MNYKPVKTAFRWTGDGFGMSNARLFKQLKRVGDVALYERTVESSGRPDGWEVVHITRHNGFTIGKGKKAQFIEPAESYPGAAQGGGNATYLNTLERAETVFAEWVAEAAAKPVVDGPRRRGRPRKVQS